MWSAHRLYRWATLHDENKMSVDGYEIEGIKAGAVSVDFVCKVHATLLGVDIEDVFIPGPFAIHVCTVHACCDTSNTKPNTAECQSQVGSNIKKLISRGGGCTYAAKTARPNEALAARQPACLFDEASAHSRSRYHGRSAICRGSE